MGGMLNTIKYRLSLHRRKSKDCGATVEDMQTRKTSDQPDRKAIISIEKKIISVLETTRQRQNGMFKSRPFMKRHEISGSTVSFPFTPLAINIL